MISEPTIQCHACADSGWVTGLECDGRTEYGKTTICGRDRLHLPHTYARECGCRAANREYQRRQGRPIEVHP